MTDVGTGAFLSYAHDDDRLDQGNIRSLAARLSSEYSLITGRPLEIFVDRTSIQWGDEWRRRIDKALTATTFFIPIITPRYFTRPECRREAIVFHGGAQSLGVTELLLPILYIPVPNFNENNPDEVVALLSRYQHVDWTDNRLVDPSSAQYRRSLNELASRLADVSSAANEKQLTAETRAITDGAEQDGQGLLELIEQINALLPEWLESLENTEVNGAQFDATWAVYSGRLRKLERSGGMAGPRLALMRRLAQDELPIARRSRDLATIYLRKSIEIDPLIMQATRIVDRDPETVAALTDLRATLAAAESGIQRNMEQEERGAITAAVWARQRAHMSTLVRELADVWQDRDTAAHEGNQIVGRWLAMLDEMLGDFNDAGAG